MPPELEAAARGGKRTRGAGLVRLEGMDRKRYILQVSPDVYTDSSLLLGVGHSSERMAGSIPWPVDQSHVLYQAL